ncbi:hypothetical protein A176_000631 [Myxococcus hansupus]|uniref:Uncharacterized protein n=1 Tax=Pseudomyxococcus hansupus TaxID=1297742 RepID=A0A0H4WLU9_9BACT|nr:hypothetical protein [Myxococcus hansupus]AKQ63719.1 hypothetical protein A176_000631 [Myxococcus hansupus]
MTAPAPTASTLAFVGIAGVSLLMLAAWLALAWRASRGQPDSTRVRVRFTVALLSWAGGWLVLAHSGLLSRLDVRPPPSALLPPALFLATGLLLWAREGHLLARHTPLWLLVGVQAFRLPLEVVMHQAALEGVMPAQMTFGEVRDTTGLNYDIVTGITALPLALWLYKGNVPRGVITAWNTLGCALLLTILAIGVASTPLFAGFGTAPTQLNTWVLFAPYVWLPTVLVGSALLGHALIFRQLWVSRAP